MNDEFDDRDDDEFHHREFRDEEPQDPIDPDEHRKLKEEHALAMATINTIVSFLRALSAIVETESRGATGDKAQLLTAIGLLLKGVRS